MRDEYSFRMGIGRTDTSFEKAILVFRVEDDEDEASADGSLVGVTLE